MSSFKYLFIIVPSWNYIVLQSINAYRGLKFFCNKQKSLSYERRKSRVKLVDVWHFFHKNSLTSLMRETNSYVPQIETNV